ncbi:MULTISPECIES: DoxX family protein [unclassified Oceanobacter]|uniref:HvfX family Cu-binding RiPP maturation protein n=1 Tax=unclassified Oceanobacter TaxID=2620260 RepID=UPI0027355185|nr:MULTISPECIES: DoxX family protein [unclassified Oceanobacter]MDP2505005.1 DoxX family protein [Oceanobacter sp. 3_MG-2023]MDP2548566.1 DoxX family protein [Oceanobacter sp. 4_MG-2023]
MSLIDILYRPADRVLRSAQPLDGLAPLLMRLYLAPVLMQSGWDKMMTFDKTVSWFGNTGWGLGLPMPEVLVALVSGFEFFGAWLLIVGLAVRWISIPLMLIMIMAALSVHWQYGWLAIADASSWLANERIMASAERLEAARTILQEHGHYDWLTGRGAFAILNNGIEFVATYFIMLLSLFFTGGGRYLSMDYWIARRHNLLR